MEAWIKWSTFGEQNTERLFIDRNLRNCFSKKVEKTVSKHQLRWWLGVIQSKNNYLSQWWPRLLMHVTKSQGLSKIKFSKQNSIIEILYVSHSIICYGPTDNKSALMKAIARFQLLTVNRWWWRATWRYVVSLSHSEPVQVMTCAPAVGTSNYIPQYLWGVITCACPWCLIRCISVYIYIQWQGFSNH